MSEEFSLLDLAPAPLVFRDEAFGGDGGRHEWRMLADLGLEDLGTLRRIQDELGRASAALSKASPSADDLDRMATRLAEGFNAFLRLMLPTLPAERLAAIPLRGKQYMLERWRAAQPAEEAGAVPLGPAGPAYTPRQTFARLVAAYGLTAMDLWRHTPQWALRILIDELPAIEAAQLQRMAQAASFPWLKDEPRRALTRDLASLTAPAGTARGPDIAALMAAGDLDAAAAAMTALGIAVRRVETA